VRHEATTTKSQERSSTSAIRVITTAPKVASDPRPVDRAQAGYQVKYPRQGSNKPSGSRGKPQKERPPGANSGTAKRGRSAGLKKAAKKAKPVKKAKPAKKAKRAAGRKGGAR